MVHLAGTQIGVNRTSEVLGIQGKRKTVRRRITQGIGTGGTQKLKYPCYTYTGVEPGFAEHDLDEYDKVADAVAWTRSLDTIRKGFSAELDIERPWEENEERKFSVSRDQAARPLFNIYIRLQTSTTRSTPASFSPP